MNRNVCLCLAFFLLFTGCSLAPRYERPEQAMPAEWRSVEPAPAPLDTDWWVRFTDPALTALIEEALKNNQDLAESLAKIDSAAAQAGIGASALFPAVTAGIDANAQQLSEKTVDTLPFEETGRTRSYTTYQRGISTSWAVDLWGKYRNQYTALTDVFMSTVFGHEALRLAVAGQVAQGYFALLAQNMQLDTARRTLKSREESFGIYTSRYKQGDITELDWQRARAEVETARAQVHASTVGLDRTQAALAVLVGRSPREIVQDAVLRGKELDTLPSPPVLPAGLPSELLERRPDLRAAEFMIMAYNANIGAARAEFFPSVSLTGMFGSLSASVGNLFLGAASVWSYGGTASLPLLDFGRNWYGVKDAEAQKKASVAVYRKAVQTAFQDIRIALAAQREADAIVRSIGIQADSLRRAVEIATLQYDNGYTDYLTVLDAQRQLFAVEMQHATALRDRLDAVVNVCLALGGGWQDPRPSSEATDSSKDSSGVSHSGASGAAVDERQRL